MWSHMILGDLEQYIDGFCLIELWTERQEMLNI